MRLQQFDALKLFAIFMVIWGHCIQYMLSSLFRKETISIITISSLGFTNFILFYYLFYIKNIIFAF